MPDRIVYTVPEVAEILRIAKQSAYDAVHRGEIPSIRLGRRLLISRAALDALIGAPAPREREPQP